MKASVTKYIGFLLVIPLLIAPTAWASPINLEIGDFSLGGDTTQEFLSEDCPPELGCSLFLQVRTRLRFSFPEIPPPNPLSLKIDDPTEVVESVELIEGVWSDLTAAERALLRNLGWTQQSWQNRAGAAISFGLSPAQRESIRKLSFSFYDWDQRLQNFSSTLGLNFEPQVAPQTLSLTLQDSITGQVTSSDVNLYKPVSEPSTLLLFVIGLPILKRFLRQKP